MEGSAHAWLRWFIPRIRAFFLDLEESIGLPQSICPNFFAGSFRPVKLRRPAGADPGFSHCMRHLYFRLFSTFYAISVQCAGAIFLCFSFGSPHLQSAGIGSDLRLPHEGHRHV